MLTATRKRIILALFIILLVFGVFFLVIMQTSWASQAARASKEEMERNLLMSVSSALLKIQDELDVIYTLLYIEPGDFLEENWKTFYNNAKFLENDTRFFNFTNAIYLLPRAEKRPVLLYSREKGLFVPGNPPDYLKDYRNALNKEDLAAFIGRLNQYNINIIPINAETAGSRNGESGFDGNTLALLVVEIDTKNLLVKELPLYLKDALGKYSFRIRQAGTAYYTSPEIAQAAMRKPDFLYPLVFPFAPRFPDDVLFIGKAAVPGTQVFTYRTKYPNFRFLLQRRDKVERFVKLPGSVNDTDLMLEIFYPGGPFQVILARQTFFNEAVSIIILTTLVVSLLFLFRLYTRMQKLREKEQEFVATISHELRTPIAVIQASSDNLYRGIISDQEKIRKYGQVIKDQVKRLSLMVENILRYAGMEGSRSIKKNHESWIEGRIFFPEILASLNELAAKKNVQIQCRDESIKGKIKADPVALALVLENLLMNAIHHGTDPEYPGNEIRLQVKRRVPHGVIFIVEDEGSGIPAREQKKVFTPFYRGLASIKKQIPGSGLGLHLVKRVTEMLGGTVALESPYLCLDGHLQHGCRFTLHFPFEADDG